MIDEVEAVSRVSLGPQDRLVLNVGVGHTNEKLAELRTMLARRFNIEESRCLILGGSDLTIIGPDYPYEEGDWIVLGPEVFADKDGTVIAWKGENFYSKERSDG